MSESRSQRFVFPPWANYLMPAALLLIVGGGIYTTALLTFAGAPSTTAVGYAPVQPIPFSHAVHAGSLGLDCRYCHTTVISSAFAALPATQTCMNCHATVLPDSPKLALLRECYETGQPIPWRKVHDLPDYVHFDHSAHVNKGIGCTTCHGPVQTMDVVRQVHPLSMAWCLDCHRDPTPHLRPRNAVTRTDWDPANNGRTQRELGRELAELLRIPPRLVLENCSTCHH